MNWSKQLIKRANNNEKTLKTARMEKGNILDHNSSIFKGERCYSKVHSVPAIGVRFVYAYPFENSCYA